VRIRHPVFLLPLLLLALLGRAWAADALDISKPILTRDGARGCVSSAALTRLLAGPADGSSADCFAVAAGTNGYFMDQKGRPPTMILLDIKVDFRMRLLWLPTTALRNP